MCKEVSLALLVALFTIQSCASGPKSNEEGKGEVKKLEYSLPVSFTKFNKERYTFEIVDESFRDITEFNSVMNTKYPSMEAAKKALPLKNVFLNISAVVQDSNGNTSTNIPIDIEASANYKSLTIVFHYIRYSAFSIPDKIKQPLLANYSFADDASIVLGGHVLFVSKIDTSNLAASGSYIGLVNAALENGTAKAEITTYTYGIAHPDLSDLLGIATSDSQNSLSQLSTLIQVIQSLTYGMDVDLCKLGFRFKLKEQNDIQPSVSSSNEKSNKMFNSVLENKGLVKME